jgi:quinol monooxygenase YgiN
MLTIVARYKAQPGKGGTVAEVLSKHVAATRAEPGCLHFDAFRSTEEGDEFVLFERYDDEAALEAHRSSPHFVEYVQGRIVPLLAERTWHRYDEVSPET